MRLLIGAAFLSVVFTFSTIANAHRSGCHRWHSCPSDTGSYVCGDLGYSNYCPRKKQSSKSKPSPSVSKALVVSVQDKLRRLGYYKGALDGLVGPSTTAAIKKFQKEFSLKMDGRATKKLEKQLKNMLG